MILMGVVKILSEKTQQMADYDLNGGVIPLRGTVIWGELYFVELLTNYTFFGGRIIEGMGE